MQTLSRPLSQLALVVFLVWTVIPHASFSQGLEPSGLVFIVDPNVPAAEIHTIAAGIDFGRTYIDAFLGGDAPEIFRQSSSVRIVATGEGNPEPAGRGSCCTAFSVSNPSVGKIFFDVLHPNWINPSPLGSQIDQLHSAAHEYTHIWQLSIGCISVFNQPLGDWMNEGIAEYVSYSALVKAGFLTRRRVREFEYTSADFTGELDFPLSDFGGTSSPVWPGHVGYLAVAELVHRAPDGELSIRKVCERVSAGQSVEDAFLASFGISLQDFYDSFVPSPLPPRPDVSSILIPILQLLESQ